MPSPFLLYLIFSFDLPRLKAFPIDELGNLVFSTMTVNVIPSSPLLRTLPVSPLLISKWYNKIFIWGTREMTRSVKCMLYRYEGLGCNSQISKRGKAGNGSIHTYNPSSGETDKQSSGAQCPLNLVCLESPSERPCPPQKKVDSDWVQSLEHVVKPVSICKVASFISGSE